MKIKLALGICIVAGSSACNQARNLGMKQAMLTTRSKSIQSHVLVRDFNHNTKVVEVDPRKMKLGVFKKKVRDFSGIPVRRQRILFNGKYLINDDTLLSSYGIDNESSLNLMSTGLMGGTVYGPYGSGDKGVSTKKGPKRLNMCNGVNVYGNCSVCRGEASSHHGMKGKIDGELGNGHEMHHLQNIAFCHLHNIKLKNLTRIIFFKCKFEIYGILRIPVPPKYDGVVHKVKITSKYDKNGYREFPRHKWEEYNNLYLKAIAIKS